MCASRESRRLFAVADDVRQLGLDVKLICVFEASSLIHVVSQVFRLSTDADPTSHRVRLWRGLSASKVLHIRVFFPRVRLHGHPEV